MELSIKKTDWMFQIRENPKTDSADKKITAYRVAHGSVVG
jgi:hypothetical protein